MTPSLAGTLAPSGRLRAAINFGNPVLAQRDPQTGALGGVSVAIARELGRRLDVPVDLVPFDKAGDVFAALERDAWDVAFLAIEPARTNAISFTPPYVLLEGVYLVPNASPLQTVDDVDHAGHRIAVVRGSAYDLYLTRTVKHAELVRLATAAEAANVLVRESLDAVAGVRQPITAFAATRPGFRILPGRFMSIDQAVGIPKARDAAAPGLRAFVEELKGSGFVARALAASGQADATIAPPAG
jgi:polar amino acid transport system substrate-binding protein